MFLYCRSRRAAERLSTKKYKSGIVVKAVSQANNIEEDSLQNKNRVLTSSRLNNVVFFAKVLCI